MVDRVNEDTRNATAAQEGQEASTTETLDSGSQPLSESVAQLAQNEPENTGENQQETGQETPDDPQELISQALAVLAEQGFDVEDGIDLEDPAVVAALQDAGFSIDQLVLAVAEVTGEQIEPAAGPEAGPAGAADGGGDRFAPTDPGSIDDGIGISGLLDPRGLEPSPLLADPTGFGDGLDLSISVSVQTDLDGVAGLGLFEDWQPIQAESQDPGGSSGFTDSDTNFDTQMYQDLRDTAGDLSYTPFDSLGNPGEDFLFPGNLVFDIDAEPDTVPVDYGPLEISGAPAGSYLFYVDGDNTIQRFDFVDGTETFTLSDVSEAYLEGNNIFILPPEDSDVDFTLDVSLDVEALGDTITFTGDVPVVLDAVADLPDVDARGGETGIFIDADDVNGDVEVDADGAFIFTEDNSQNSFFDELPPINPPVEEPQPSGLENSDYREFEQGDRGLQDGPREGICCYKGTVYNEQPIYNLPFATSVTDRDRAFDRDPSEGLTEIRIALGENTEKNNTEVAAELPPFGRGGFHASIGEQLLNADTLLDDEDNPLEVQVTLPASYWSEETGFVSQGDGGEILITVTLDPDTLDQDTGELVFNDFQVLGEDGETPIEGVRIQDIDFGDFSVHLPRHADNDLNVSVSSTVEELRASVGTDGEITTENNTATNTQDYEVNFLAVADGTQIIVTDYSEIIGEGGGLCDFTPPQDSPNTSRDDYGKLEGDEWGGTYTAIFAEDGEESRDQHGYDNDAGEPRDESRLEIPLHFTATQIDQDGSESVTKFTIDLYGTDSSDPLPAGTEITYPANSDDGVVIARFNEDGELELEDVDLSSITFNTTEGTEVTGSLSIEGGKLVVDLDENSEAAGEGIVLDGEIGVRLPIDSSKDFSAEFEVTTAETDATGAVLPGLECNTTKSTIDFDVKGVAGPAEVGFTSYEDEACRPIYGEGSESVPSDLTSASESGPNGVSLHGFGFGVAFMANGALDLSDEASGSVIFDGNGAGVRVGNDNGENRGGQVPDQIGHDPDGDGGSSEALVAEL
uniref:hypothetical protein n=1 Tax=Fodinicurvata sediminis TaxID=1121832 RepID=UPI00047CBC73